MTRTAVPVQPKARLSRAHADIKFTMPQTAQIQKARRDSSSSLSLSSSSPDRSSITNNNNNGFMNRRSSNTSFFSSSYFSRTNNNNNSNFTANNYRSTRMNNNTNSVARNKAASFLTRRLSKNFSSFSHKLASRHYIWIFYYLGFFFKYSNGFFVFKLIFGFFLINWSKIRFCASRNLILILILCFLFSFLFEKNN